MRFNVIVGNPPYQLDRNSNSKAIYNLFIDLADKLKADTISYIVPARWLSDKPNGLESTWLNKMRQREDIVVLKDYKESTAVFPTVNIAGGVCYFMIETGYKGDCNYKIVDSNNEETETMCKLNYNGIIIRDTILRSIVTKVNELSTTSIQDIIYSNRAFTSDDILFNTNWKGFVTTMDDEHTIRYYGSNKVIEDKAYVSEKELVYDKDKLYKKFKLLLPYTGPATGGKIINLPFIAGTDSCSSRTFAPICGEPVDNNEKATNCIKYFRTKFFRAIVSSIKTTQHASRLVYKFVPLQDFTNNSNIKWNDTIENIDSQLYKIYGLTNDEIKYIENKIESI